MRIVIDMANQHFGTKVIERDFTETGVAVINYADVLAEVGLVGTVLDGGHGSTVNEAGDTVFPNTTHPILFYNDDGLHGVNILVINQERASVLKNEIVAAIEAARLEIDGGTPYTQADDYRTCRIAAGWFNGMSMDARNYWYSLPSGVFSFPDVFILIEHDPRCSMNDGAPRAHYGNYDCDCDWLDSAIWREYNTVCENSM